MIPLGKVQATFTSREELARGLAALREAGVRDEQVEIREQRPRTGAPGFEYVDDEDLKRQSSMTSEAVSTMAATGDTLVGNPATPTTDTRLGDVLRALLRQEEGEEGPEYRAGTRYEVTVASPAPGDIENVLSDQGGKDVKRSGR